MFLKKLIRSSGCKPGNEGLFLEGGTSPGLALLGTDMQGLGERTELHFKEGGGELMDGLYLGKVKE